MSGFAYHRLTRQPANPLRGAYCHFSEPGVCYGNMVHSTTRLQGAASPAGTTRFRQRHAALHPQHWRAFHDLSASSMGLGTYLGDPDARTDAAYAEAIAAAVGLGCNVLDTAINYRCQRSERAIGAALGSLISSGTAARDELLICTKGGYLPFDGEMPADPARYVVESVIEPGLAAYDDLAAGCHCIAPSYLEHALTASLANLGLETLDVYYLHNPEQQLDAVDRGEFLRRMASAFAWLEAQVAAGRIRRYGIATWNGLRANPKTKEYLGLEELAGLAATAGGAAHHFRVIQLPYNLAMPEAFGFANQQVAGEWLPALQAAESLGLRAVASASLLQSRLATLPAALESRLPGPATSAQRAIQFARSTPGITVSLVGMSRRAHVEENLALARSAPFSAEQIRAVFKK